MKVDLFVNALLIAYITSVLYVAFQVNRVQPDAYMDEIFHYPMTSRYFEGNFTYWDPKITTFPGLYIIGTLFCKTREGVMYLLGIISDNTCPLSSLRYMNVGLLLLTGLALYWIIQKLNPENKCVKSFLWMIQILSLPTVVAPFFLYYTDGLSLFTSTVSILLALLSNRGFDLPYVLSSAIFTIIAIGVRQTNIILAVLNPALIILQRYNLLYVTEKHPSFLSQFGHLLYLIYSEFRYFMKLVTPFITILILFIIFFIRNGFSVVVGDRANHTMSFHFMQICYFSVYFCIVFVDDIVLRCYYEIRKHEKISTKKIIFDLIRFVCVCSMVTLYLKVCYYDYRFVTKFTIIHPFIKSDNRHFVFYIFKDIIIPHQYLLIPVYTICIIIMMDILSSSLSMIAIVIMSILFGVILVSSPVVEFRYFSLPLLVFVATVRPKTHPILSLVTSIICNTISSYLFIYRPFIWNDGSVARFMW